jgi:hypothetical protein
MESSCDSVADSHVATEAELLWSEQSPPTSSAALSSPVPLLVLVARLARAQSRREVQAGHGTRVPDK